MRFSLFLSLFYLGINLFHLLNVIIDKIFFLVILFRNSFINNFKDNLSDLVNHIIQSFILFIKIIFDNTLT